MGCQYLPQGENVTLMVTSAATTGIDMPFGRVDYVLSGITGKTMAYFTPDPLPVLINRCHAIDVPRRVLRAPISGLLLLRAVSRDAGGGIDLNQARRFVEFLGGRRLSSLDDFLALGGEVSAKAGSVRKEIVFAGGKIPTSARHIYPPEEVVPDLLDALESGSASPDLPALDPLIRAAVVGVFCTCVHPFLDGNGRWSRLMAFSMVRAPTDIWPSLVAVAFMNACKDQLVNDIWPDAIIHGLRRYLHLAMRFEQELDASFDTLALHALIERIDQVLLAGLPDQKKRLYLLGGLFASGRLPVGALRKMLGLSQQAAEGRLRAVADESGSTRFEDGALRADGLVQILDARIKAAADSIN